ncbi:MAG: efflux RND transporter periplasmic adaptor subunit [Pseudomonadota bacterium]
MAFPIKLSHILAVGLTAGVGFYMLGGTTMISGQGPVDPDVPARAGGTAGGNEPLFAVRARDFTAQEKPTALTMRGRTEADASVAVSAETDGRVVEVAVSEGTRVTQGDVLCRLDEAARQASVRQARASLLQAEIDLEASQTLAENGFAAQNSVPALQAAFDAAQAMVEQAELDLERTVITAPIDGVVQLPLTDVGIHLESGHVCATLLDTDPLLVIGQISERDIGQLALGMPADVDLVTGERASGTVNFIAATANTETRTFQVDIHIPNPEGTLRGGVTAEASIRLPAVIGHLLPLSTLQLDDEGNIGVSLVNDDNRVEFHNVQIITDEAETVWVAGLPDEARVIVLGQDFVEDGQEVVVATADETLLQTSQATSTQPRAVLEAEGAAQ